MSSPESDFKKNMNTLELYLIAFVGTFVPIFLYQRYKSKKNE